MEELHGQKWGSKTERQVGDSEEPADRTARLLLRIVENKAGGRGQDQDENFPL